MPEKLFFPDSKGNKLCGVLAETKNKTDDPILVLCHGFASSKDGNKYSTAESLLPKKGVATFRFDFYGHGESEGKFEDITIMEGKDDVLQAVKFLKARGYKKIALLGNSFGGMSCLLAAVDRQADWVRP